MSERPFSIRIIENDKMLPGFHVLMRNGRVIWLGRLGAPIEHVELDTIIMHPTDANALKQQFAHA